MKYPKQEFDRSEKYTFVNGGTMFPFYAEKYAKHYKRNRRGATMLKIHAELTLEAMAEGRKDVYIETPQGHILNHNELIHCATKGRLNIT